MKKLYKFFFLLFCVFLAISFIYGTIISFLTFKVIQASATNGIKFGTVPFTSFMKFGLVQGLLYGLILLLFTIFLVNRALNNGQRFTIRSIIIVTLWFYAVTTLVYGIHYLSFPTGWDFSGLFLLLGPQFILPSQLWFPFPLAWLSLFIILAARIKKNE